VDFQLSLNSEPISSAHPTDPLPVEPDTPVRDVLALLKAQKSSCVLVCSGGVLEGIFTERDALKLMARRADLSIPVRDVMVPRPTGVSTAATVGDAILAMSKGGYRRVPIVDQGGAPTGVVGGPGILHYLVEHFPQAVYNLPPEPGQISKEREGA
jgi:CBS domain-containing protein